MGLTHRRLYKPERRPARRRGVLHDQAPVGCPNATVSEIAMAIASICEAAHVAVGRGGMYDSIRDEYTIIGKDKRTGKAQDFKIEGVAVAALINELRIWNGVPQFDAQALVKAVG